MMGISGEDTGNEFGKIIQRNMAETSKILQQTFIYKHQKYKKYVTKLT